MKKLFMLLCVATLSTMHGMEDNPEALRRKFVSMFIQEASRADLLLQKDPSTAFNKIMNHEDAQYYRHPIFHLANDFKCIGADRQSKNKGFVAYERTSNQFTSEERRMIFPFIYPPQGH